MKTVCKKLLCLMLVAMMLVSAIPAAFAAPNDKNPSGNIQQGGFGNPFEGNDKDNPFDDKFEKPETTDVSVTVIFDDGDAATADNEEEKTVKVTVGEKVKASALAKKVTKKAFANVIRCDIDGTVYEYDAEVEVTADLTKVYVRVAAKSENDQQGGNQGNNNQGWPNNGGNNQGNNNQGWPNNGGNNNQGNNNHGHKPGDFPGNGYDKFNFKTAELTVVYNFPDNYRHMGKTSETFKVWKGSDILDALEAAEEMGYYDEPTRDGYTLAGYSFDKECKDDVNRDDEINGKLTIYCEWEKSKVTLRVYTNGDTKYPDRTFSLDSYARDGKITRTEVEDLLDSKYSAKSGYTLAYYGLFTADTWDKGDYDVDDAASSVSVHKKGETVIYVMVKNVKQSTADSSNPKTGDNIMIAVTTMALAAVALVSMVELKKRKMI